MADGELEWANGFCDRLGFPSDRVANVLATNGHIHDELSALLQKTGDRA